MWVLEKNRSIKVYDVHGIELNILDGEWLLACRTYNIIKTSVFYVEQSHTLLAATSAHINEACVKKSKRKEIQTAMKRN